MFTVLKFIGAGYLIYLGVKLWRTPVQAPDTSGNTNALAEDQPLRIFLHSYIVTALNPKSIIFFVAFLPQFLDASQPILAQMMVFQTTSLVLAATAYALLASLARNQIRKQPSVQRAVNRTGGTLMVGAGLLAAGWRKAA